MADNMLFPGLAKLEALLHGDMAPVLRPPLPKYNSRFDLYGPRETVHDIAELLGEEHFSKPIPQQPVRTGKMYTIGELAKMLERKAQTMRLWRDDGTLPEADHFTEGIAGEGRKRLYTERQVWGLRIIALEEGVLNNKRCKIKETNFRQRAYDLWDECAAYERAMRRP